MLQEENESILEKVKILSPAWFLSIYLRSGFVLRLSFFFQQLRLEDEKCKEAEARVRELEKQVIGNKDKRVRIYLKILFSPLRQTLGDFFGRRRIFGS